MAFIRNWLFAAKTRIASVLMIRTKVLLAFMAVLVTTLGLGLFSIQRLGVVNDAAIDIRDTWLPRIMKLSELDAELKLYRALELRHIVSVDELEKTELERQMRGTLGRAQKLRSEYEPYIAAGEERRLVGVIDSALEKYLKASEDVLKMSREGKGEIAYDLFKSDQEDHFRHLTGALEENRALNASGARQSAENGAALYLTARTMIMTALVFSTLLCLGAAILIVAGVSRPILRIADAMRKLAARDMETEIIGLDRKDEIGQMAAAVQVFKDSMIEADRLAAERLQEQKRKEERQQAVEMHITTFEAQASKVIEGLSKAATEMRATSQGLSATAEETSRQSQVVAAGSTQASASVQTVAAAAEELLASIHEVARQMTHSAKVAGKAASNADRTDQAMKGLGDAVGKIGSIVKLIQDIAGQTNLLALNATIEAARAGEAGKGFAVVASEVKSLATQTTKATEEIAGQIGAVQNATNHAIATIAEINSTIVEMNGISSAVAAAAEEQSAATAEITRNAQEAARGTHEVSENIVGVSTSAASTGEDAARVLAASNHLSQQSEAMRAEIDRFLAAIRVA